MNEKPTEARDTVIGYASPPLGERPTNVRLSVVGIMTATAFLMYLDRICMSQMVNSESFRLEFGFDKTTTGYVLGAFFLAYAAGQLPAGWLADRFGSRTLMTIFITVWSFFTLATGFATGFWTLLFARIGCGLAEAGGYPASSGLLSRWIPVRTRGRASSIVAAGGRLGGALAPALTALVILWIGNWRAAGWVFGGIGIFFAWAFWVGVRDRPADHPRVNRTELDEIAHGLPPEQGIAPAHARRFPIMGLIRNKSMWYMCAHQVLTNMGWVFLATLMPTFLKEVKGLSDEASGTASTIALTVGMMGMLGGGWLTDMLTRRFGPRRGRMIPLAWGRLIGAAAYLSCLIPGVPAWVCVAAFATVAVMTDLGVPATWSYCQDVGGRNVAAVLAWPNMWGNMGAAVMPALLTWINVNYDANHDWHESLAVAAVAFLGSGLVAFGVHADKKIEGTGAEEPGADQSQGRGFAVVPISSQPPADRPVN